MDEQEIELEIGKLVTTLASLYPSTQIGKSTIGAYVSMLKDVPLGILQAAVDQISVESRFFPTVAEIRERVLMLQIPDLANGMTAWGDVKKAFARYGFYRTPKFDNPITAEAVDRMGWKELCCSENPEADRAHFARIYDDLVKRSIQDAKLLPASRMLRETAQKQLGSGTR